ncbi:hypothetical protein AZE42_11161 [Rhizopogon vesiculosus]|uniref:Uncharacterized protein n=1 Tax=Rhizopogon vesiculosus TaxID=180088 RepID=A0A1J8PZ81_9AGAM|nr:hypothetical protein AZE42_11161 [Rhizopogon vesiculosus]
MVEITHLMRRHIPQLPATQMPATRMPMPVMPMPATQMLATRMPMPASQMLLQVHLNVSPVRSCSLGILGLLRYVVFAPDTL